MIALAQSEATQSVAIDIAYDLVDSKSDYDDLFVQTAQGNVVTPSLVPDMAKFTDLLRLYRHRTW